MPADGYEFSQEYYGLPSSVYTSSAATPLGDLYRHGGWFTVFVGMLLLGMTCRLFDPLVRPERDPRAIFFSLAFLPFVVKAEVDVFSILVSVPSGIVAALIGVHLCCGRQRDRPAAQLDHGVGYAQGRRSCT